MQHSISRGRHIPSKTLDAARRVFEVIGSTAPPQTTREVLEGLTGHRVSRIQVSSGGLDAIDLLSRELDFGASVADYKIVCLPKTNLGGWSDSVSDTLPLSSPHGEYLIYIGATKRDAENARIADASCDSRRFGELAGIPECCRTFYVQQVEGGAEGDPLKVVLSRSQLTKLVPMGCNIAAQFIGLGFLSHYPCSLACHATARVSRTRYALMSIINDDFANQLRRGLSFAYLITGSGLSAFQCDPGTWPNKENLVARLGATRDWEDEATEFQINNRGQLEARRNGIVINQMQWPEAFLLRPSRRWS